MMQRLPGLAALAAALPLFSAGPAVDPKAAHGDFTDEVKPVLYVADVEESALRHTLDPW